MGEQVTRRSTWQCVTCLDTGVQLHLNEGGIVYCAHILSNTPHILQLLAHMCAAALGDATYHHKHNDSSSLLPYSSLISRWLWPAEKTNKENSDETCLDIYKQPLPTVANPQLENQAVGESGGFRQNGGNEGKSLCSHVTLGRHMCHRRWLFPPGNPFHPLVQSLLFSYLGNGLQSSQE